MAGISSEVFATKLHVLKLMHLAANGSLRDLKASMRGRNDIYFVDFSGSSLLHHAVSNSNTDVLEYLIKEGIPVHAQDIFGRTPLSACALNGRLENMRLLISHGSDIHAKDNNGFTALHNTAFNMNSRELISCLIGAGAKVEEKNSSGITALHLCAQQGNVEGMMSLVREGADIAVRSVEGHTPLHTAVFDQTSRAIEYLLSLGVEIDARENSGNTPLHLCASEGNLRNMKVLVKAGADPKAANKFGYTSLHFSARNQSTSEVMKYLLKLGIPFDSRDRDGCTPLHSCARSGTVKNLEVLFAVDKEFERKDEFGRTPLHYAAMNKVRAGMLSYLLNKGASMDTRDKYGHAAIHLCASHGTTMNMQILLRSGADIEMHNAHGDTPLFCAIQNENAREMIQYLLSQGAAINAQDKNGFSLLHLCVTNSTLDIVKFLVENGADTRAENSHGFTALYMAVRCDKHEMVEYLASIETTESKRSVLSNRILLDCIATASLKNLKILLDTGVDVGVKDENGATALHHAATNKEYGVAELILNKGIPLDATSNNGATPLHRCAEVGTLETLMFLVEKGANIHARDENKQTALYYAARNSNAAKVVEFLLKHGLSIEARDNVEKTALHHYAQYGTLQSIKAIIDKVTDINARSIGGSTALHFAARNAATSDIIDFLLSRGMLIEARNKKGFTPLHYSISDGKVGNMKLLIEKGADVKARGEDNITALHFAASYGDDTETLQYLLQKGASINANDRNGRTPLLACACNGNLLKMKFLVANGADIRVRDEQGLSSLHLAAVNEKSTEIIQYLLDEGMMLEAQDKLGRTPLLYSAACGNLQSVEFLCGKEADLKALNILKQTVLHHAARNANGGQIIEYLLGKGLSVDARDELGLSPVQISRAFGITENERILLKNGARDDPLDPLISLTLAMMKQQMQ